MQNIEFRWQRLPVAALAMDTNLSAAWDKLNEACQNLPFMTADVITLAARILGDGGEQLLVGRARGEIAAMLVIAPQRGLRWQTFQPSQLPLGAWVAQRHWSAADIARSLFRRPSNLCLAISLTQIDPWLAPRPPDTESVFHTDYVETGWIDIVGDFEAYWEARGKNLKQNMRKQRSKLAADGVLVTTRSFQAARDMAGAIDRYGALESAGWKAGQGTAIKTDNLQGRFYRALLEQAADLGGAVVYECMFNDRTVAMNLCLRQGSTLVVLKTTYDQSIKGYSPAFLLNQDIVEELFRQREVRRLEYYGRLMDWHTKWTDNKRMLYHMSAYRWPIVKRMALRRAEGRRRALPAPAVATD